MYKFTGFSEKANTALNNAVNCAEDMGHTYVGSEHIIAGLLKDPGSVAGVMLAGRHITYNAVYERIRNSVGVGVPTELTTEDITPRCRKVIENSLTIAGSAKNVLAGTEHLLTAVLRDPRCFGCKLLIRMGISPGELITEMNRALPDGEAFLPQKSYIKQQKQTADERQTLQKYGRDLTEAAALGKLDTVTGRDAEIDRMIKILCRKTKNNPCLIGEPGVGKTAIVEGLAIKIASGNVPEKLKDTQIYSLELTGMVAGAKYRGDFEERIKNAVNEVVNAGNIILFIDEIHNLIGAGSAEGAVDAANILKPVLSRGEIKLIGATTVDEYRKNIEKDAALERRFQTVNVREPSKEQTLAMLMSLRPAYEAHHGVKITDGAIKAAVEQSSRYITDRFLPDKAIDLIDEAAASVSLGEKDRPEEITRLETAIKELSDAKIKAVNSQDFEKAAYIRDKEKAKLRELCEIKAMYRDSEQCKIKEVTEEDISAVTSSRTDIPVQKLNLSEKEKLLGLEGRLNERIIGQPKAVRAVSAAVKRSRAGLKSPSRPMGTYLFCGPTGVGKTQLAKELAKELFGSEKALLRFDMTEYSEKHSVSRLLGPPPGYVGFDDGGQLTEKLRRKPYSVVLFDEIEKAHPDIFNALLQILDDGIITSSQGKTADCRNCIFILTSNAGGKLISSKSLSMGFGDKTDDRTDENIRTAVNGELKKFFTPEFLNRIDETVIFTRLTPDDIKKIAEIFIRELTDRLEAVGVKTSFDDNVISHIAKKGYDETNGARYLRRTVLNEIENPLSDIILQNDLTADDVISVSVEDGIIKFKKQ